jgi:DNA-binding GntR family transcriptional regulator
VARNLLLRAQAIGILEKGAKAHWYVVPLDEDRLRDIFEVRATLEHLVDQLYLVVPGYHRP